MDTVKVKQCIICKKGRRGSGESQLSPIRAITEVFDLNGNLISERDPYSFDIEQIETFIRYRFDGDLREKVLEWAAEYFITD